MAGDAARQHCPDRVGIELHRRVGIRERLVELRIVEIDPRAVEIGLDAVGHRPRGIADNCGAGGLNPVRHSAVAIGPIVGAGRARRLAQDESRRCCQKPTAGHGLRFPAWRHRRPLIRNAVAC